MEMAREIPGGTRRVTLAADRGYDTREFVGRLRELQVTPHVAQNTSGRSSAVDERTVRHEGYRLSQRARKRVEEFFENGAAAFQTQARAHHRAEQERIEHLEKKIQRKDEVLAELMGGSTSR